MNLELPPELEPYRARIEATVRPCVVLKKAEGEPSLRDSKVGGVAYWPKGIEYPTDSSGNPLYLLAQLNLDDLPKLEGFPQMGLLQFLIAADEDLGLNYEDPERGTGHKVVFHSSADLDSLYMGEIDFEEGYMPISKTPFRLCGELTSQPISPEEEKAEELIGDILTLDVDYYQQHFSAHGHRLGGYPSFMQSDPRGEEVQQVLLFQLDSDDDMEINWGDFGVANFFIRPTDLERLDFSRVLYNWDCS